MMRTNLCLIEQWPMKAQDSFTWKRGNKGGLRGEHTLTRNKNTLCCGHCSNQHVFNSGFKSL